MAQTDNKIEDKLELITAHIKHLGNKIGGELADIKGRLYHFDNFEQNFFAMKDRITHIESLLSNHVTSTDKKIDVLTKKIDLLLSEKNQV